MLGLDALVSTLEARYYGSLLDVSSPTQTGRFLVLEKSCLSLFRKGIERLWGCSDWEPALSAFTQLHSKRTQVITYRSLGERARSPRTVMSRQQSPKSLRLL